MAKKKKRHVYTGTLTKHKRGFGFVSCDEINEDVFISAASMKGAMNGDEVEIDLIPDYLWKQSPEGIITRIIRRHTEEIAGTFDRNKKFGFVIPEGRKYSEDIFVRKKDFSGARRGDKVVVSITKYPDRYKSAEGKIVEIISRAGQQGGDIKALARSFGLRDTFPSKVEAEAKNVSRKDDKEQYSLRRDLRDKIIFTIDGADSKDFDDAVSLEITANGNYLLGVHIADVAHYVKEDGNIDKEAFKRGTSVYFPYYTVPMLPKVLSNGICSLNPGEDRLTLSVNMEITPEGEVVSHEIYESIIRSAERLVYDDISDLLEFAEASENGKVVDSSEDKSLCDSVYDSGREMSEKYAHIKDVLINMHRLAKILREKRKRSGSLDFDLDEAQIELDERGIPISVEIAQRRCANRLIEEFMLLANETVAEHFYWLEAPFIYRVHEKPEAIKMEQLRVFLRSMGIVLKGSADNIHPRELGAVLSQAEGRPNENIISSVTLRAMQKAFYGTSCEGHFGLAMKYYCHFTSPIRRYPDLVIHRVIKSTLHSGKTVEAFKHYRQTVGAAAEQSSIMERKAIEAEREAEKLKKAEYMTYHVGESFDGVISGVTHFGIYVQLPNTIEGLVRIGSLDDDYYEHIPEQYALVGERSGRTYRLGDKVRVVVDNVDMGKYETEFVLA